MCSSHTKHVILNVYAETDTKHVILNVYAETDTKSLWRDVESKWLNSPVNS